MAFTNQAYQAVAEVIFNQRCEAYDSFPDGSDAQAAALATVERLAIRMADKLDARHRGAYDFKRDRFMEACGF